jgi:hypothetical protein
MPRYFKSVAAAHLVTLLVLTFGPTEALLAKAQKEKAVYQGTDWSQWQIDPKLDLVTLSFRSRCFSQPGTSQIWWETQVRNNRSTPISFTIDSDNKQKVSLAPSEVFDLVEPSSKGCKQRPHLKLIAESDALGNSEHYDYKEGGVTAKLKTPGGSGWLDGLLAVGMGVAQGAAQASEQKAEIEAQAAQERQAAEMQRRAAELQRQAELARLAQERQAQQQIELQRQQQVVQQLTQLQRQQTAQQQALQAQAQKQIAQAQQHSSSSTATSVGSRASRTPRAQDLSVTRLSVFTDSACEVHFAVANASYSVATVDVAIDLQVRGAQTSRVYRVSVPARSEPEFVRQDISCGNSTDDQLGDYAHSNIVYWSFN